MEEPALSDTTITHLSLPSMASSSSSSSLLSALEIPEIMATIFEFLDDETVNRTLILVCRQWFIWNRHRIFRDLYWNSDWTKEELERNVLSRLHLGPNRLFCHVRVRYGGDSDSAVNKWRQLVAALTWADPLKRHSQVMDDAQSDSGNLSGGNESMEDAKEGVVDVVVGGREDSSSRKSKEDDDRNRVIRHLTIRGIVQIDSHMWQILSGLSQLTSLMVKVDSCGWVSMFNILNSCPHLECIHMETTTWVSIPGSNWLLSDYAQDRDEGDHHLSSMETQQPLQRQRRLQAGARSPLALRSLVLRNAQFDQRALEAFLPSVPFLQRIQIAAWLPYLSRPTQGDRERLCQLVRTHCPLVRVFHFSYQGLHIIHTAPEDMDPVFDLCPRMTDWMVSAAHFTPSLIDRLETLQDVLTTLEIIGAECKHLHAYLCTATHLQHLKAPRTRFPAEHMDIHLRSTAGYPPSGVMGSEYGGFFQQPQKFREVAVTVAKVWACRGLLTLKLAISHMSQYPQASRIVFGYISRVCPRLRVLEICGPEGVRMDRKIRPTPMCMSLEGGFCLLARLKGLERLCVGIVMLDLKLEEVDLAWIKGERECAGGGEGLLVSSSKVRPRRGSATSDNLPIKGWGVLLRREKEQELERIRNFDRWVRCSPFLPSLGNGAGHGEGVSEGREGKQDKTGSGHSDDELEQSLQHLGLLEDVFSLLREIDTNNDSSSSNAGVKCCWPNLRRISIYSGNSLGEGLEGEYERLLGSAQMEKEKEREKGGGGLFSGFRSLVGSLVRLS